MNAQVETGPLAQELREVVARAEDLLRAISHAEETAVVQLRERATSTVNQAKTKLNEATAQARGGVEDWLQTTEQYTRENPWTAVAGSAALGLIVGALLARS